MQTKTNLKIDWATHDAAKYACENWHYSNSIPKSKLVKIGAWENGVFIGVVIFSYGATPQIGSPYRLKQTQVCELTRVALKSHKNSVSKILSIAIKFLKKANPGLRLIVSYADQDMNHHGGIYQATNWVYEGIVNVGTRSAFIIRGKKTHPRTIGLMGGIQSLKWVQKHLDSNATEFFTRGKHKYLMPLDDEMRRQIEPLRKPYPKRAGSIVVDVPEFHSGEGGAEPTPALHSKEVDNGTT